MFHAPTNVRRPLRILLAEDNEVNQLLAAMLLRKRGHQVTVVNNGQQAVEEVTRGRYDVILMDIKMPELDGFAATRAIRATPAGARVRILALTALALAGEREHCLAEGMTGYLAKPFRPQELFAAVEESELIPPEMPVGSLSPEMVRSGMAIANPVDLTGFRNGMREVGAEAAVEHVLSLFIANVPRHLAALSMAIASANGPAIEHAAHAFKSPSGSIGAHKLEQILLALELAGKAGAIDQARATFIQMGPETESVLRYLHLERTREHHD